MRKMFLLIGILSSAICLSTEKGKNSEQSTYRNPVIAYSLPDPTVIRAKDGFFYLYATEDTRNLPIHRSKDLVNWTFLGTAFTEKTRPNFEPEGGIWAPDINLINGRYVMYYSMSVWGGEWTCGIGMATANLPEGPFTDQGMLFRSNTIDVQNSIDPFYMEDKSKKYIFWGSFRGIYGIELSADGLSLKAGASKKKLPEPLTKEPTSIKKGTITTYLLPSALVVKV